MTQLKQVFQAADGTTFDTKAEALSYMRKPKIEAALNTLTKDPALTAWLIDNSKAIKNAFDTGTLKRITKSDAAKIAKAIEAIKEAKIKGTEFLIEIWPEIDVKYKPVKRINDAEKEFAIRNSLQALEGGSEELAVWVITVKDAILEAYEAGVEKRQVAPAAAEGLAAYRAKKAAEKAAKEAEQAAEDEEAVEDEG
jgi:hypothetical protein